LIRRGFDYLSFYAAAFRSVLAWAKPGEAPVAKTGPPQLSLEDLVEEIAQASPSDQ
jgi:hypothetical protein